MMTVNHEIGFPSPPQDGCPSRLFAVANRGHETHESFNGRGQSAAEQEPKGLTTNGHEFFNRRESDINGVQQFLSGEATQAGKDGAWPVLECAAMPAAARDAQQGDRDGRATPLTPH